LQRESILLLYFLGEVLLGLLLIVTIVYSIFRILKDKRKVPFFQKLLPLIVGLITILTIPAFSFLVSKYAGKKVILKAGISGDLTSVELELRDDSTFKLINSGPFGGKVYRGIYVRQKDTLRIDKGDTSLYPTLTFILKHDSAIQKDYFDPVQTDNTKESIYKLYINSNSQ
jgi:hypothetical protein